MALAFPPASHHNRRVQAFALAIFTGAFLLFQVQPLIGKYILPWYGGGPGVWNTCMLFFQVLLLGGYAYAYLLTRFLKPRRQALTHLALTLAALATLPITPDDSWKPSGGESPVAGILLLLAASLGLPYFVLSATGPLMQAWFSLAQPGKSPYRLYALSNVGSLLALVSYPFVFEPLFSRKTQAAFWGWGLAVYALSCGLSAMVLWRAAARDSDSQRAAASGMDFGSAPVRDRLFWLLLPACASALLLATTNKLCLDVAVVPFLWIAPLALYLLSFILCFDSPRWYVRFPFALALIAALTGYLWALGNGSSWKVWQQVAVYGGSLFVCCMVCHGELYRLRPDPRQLTSFYLLVAAGGALGGLFVAVLAPLVFTDYYELEWALLACGLLFFLVHLFCSREPGTALEEAIPAPVAPAVAAARPLDLERDRFAEDPAGLDRLPAPRARPGPVTRLLTHWEANYWKWVASAMPFAAFAGLDWWLSRLANQSPGVPKSTFLAVRAGIWCLLLVLVASWLIRRQWRTFRHWRVLGLLWLGLGVAALGGSLWIRRDRVDPDVVHRSRSFYGVLTLYEHRRENPEQHHLLLQHGRITHGLQLLDPAQSAWATTYYGEETGVGTALRVLKPGQRRVGVVGLGAGTLSCYGTKGDYFRIYEIDPAVVRLAESKFSYLGKSAAQVEIALGDARLSMEREPPQRFDLLALDAFSSDSIPVHLLTREAFRVYERHLNTNGVLAVHISNHFLDLEPVVVELAREFNYQIALIDYDEHDDTWWVYSSTWMLLTRNEGFLKAPQVCDAAKPLSKGKKKVPLWTDDFSSLFQILE